MTDIEKLFDRMGVENDYGSDLVEDIENRYDLRMLGFTQTTDPPFMGGTREQEIQNIEKQIKTLNQQLRSCKNNKNVRLSDLNTKLSEKRRKIRQQINELQLKLEDLRIERKGSERMKSSEKV